MRVFKVPRPNPRKPANMSQNPQLVAMVSVYNCSKWLSDRIDNLLQTKIYKRGEMLIYLAHAESPDPMDAEICKRYTEGNHGIRFERIPTCTVYGAWNWMIRHTSTTFITNANSDDLIAPDGYDIMIDACNKHQGDLAYCGWHTIGNEHRRWSDIGGPGEPIAAYNPAADQMSCGHFPLWRRSIHDRIGLFDPSFVALGDADLWYRCWVNNIRNFIPVNIPIGGYRWRDGQNLWHRASEEKRTGEWHTLASRQPGKLEFT